jgi:hypothetical protein
MLLKTLDAGQAARVAQNRPAKPHTALDELFIPCEPGRRKGKKYERYLGAGIGLVTSEVHRGFRGSRRAKRPQISLMNADLGMKIQWVRALRFRSRRMLSADSKEQIPRCARNDKLIFRNIADRFFDPVSQSSADGLTHACSL